MTVLNSQAEVPSRDMIETPSECSGVVNVSIAFETHGCRSNYADTVDLEAMCVERGARIVRFDEPADVYVLNTCTVTNTAERDALKAIKRLKVRHPQAKLIVTGCLAEINRSMLLQTGFVNAVVGTGRHSEVVESIMAICQQGLMAERGLPDSVDSCPPVLNSPSENCNSADVVTFHELRSRAQAVLEKQGFRTRRQARKRRSISLDHAMSPAVPGPGERPGGGHYRARFHLRIQEGCENSCTFCIIPFTRGGLSSRPVHRILQDLDRLCRLGYKEVVLSGTHLGGYGFDLSRGSVEASNQSELRRAKSLLELMQILEEQSPITRIRLSSLDPNDVNHELIDFISSSTKFCSHLHICFQSFSDKVLKRMNRRYSLKEAVDLVKYVEKVLPGCSIGSDLITGFPGESREDVERGMSLFRELPISYLHVFPYSERSNTPAAMLEDQVELRERKRRAVAWRAVDQEKRAAYRKGFLCKILEVVVESKIVAGPDGCGFLSGTSREFLPVKFGIGSVDRVGLKWAMDSQSVPESVPTIGSVVQVLVKSYDSIDGRLVCDLLGQTGGV